MNSHLPLNFPRQRVLSALFALAIGSSLSAQTLPAPTDNAAPAPGSTATVETTATTPSIAANLRTIPASTLGTPPSTDYNLKLAWNEGQRGTTLNYPNSTANVLTIQGIQSSGNIFVVSYPSSIPAGSSGAIQVIYLAQAATQSDSDVIRLLTSDGLKLLRIAHGRDKIASFDVSKLKWQVGDALTPKSATLTLTNGIQAVGATTFDGSSATVAEQSAGVYVISVTPGSTAANDRFPVIVTLSPAIPNTTPTIECVIGSSN